MQDDPDMSAPAPSALVGERMDEERFRAYVENANDLIFTIDTDGRFGYVSPNWRNKLGHDPSTIVGRPFAEFLHPDDVARCREEVRRVLAGDDAPPEAERTSGIEYRALHADGSWRWHAANASPLRDRGGKVLGLIGVARDIGVRKQAEQALRASEARYRLLAENANDVVWTMALDGRVTYMSPAVERVRGFTVEEAMAQTLDQTLVPESRKDVVDYFGRLHRAIAEGAELPRYRGEQGYLRRDGSVMTADVIAIPVVDDAGRPVEILGVSRDISERKRHEAELQRVNEELRRHRDHLDDLVAERTRELAAARDAAESANRAKTALPTNASHELRTPLNHIAGYAYLLESGLADPEARAQARTIAQAAAEMLRLVGDLLDTARLEAGALTLEPREFDPLALARSAVDEARPTTEAAGLELALDADTTLPARLVGDARRLAQVLHHLLDNAAKFSESGRVTLRIRAAEARAGRAEVRFEVEDQGIGVDPDFRDRLFDLFEQGDPSTTRRHGGNGIGLPLCRRIVGLMGGTIGYAPAEGGGSRFWFTVTLPLSRDSAQAAGEPPAAPSRADADAAARRLERLLADDDMAACALWSEARDLLAPRLGDDAGAFDEAIGQVDLPRALEILRARAPTP